jgi:predicted dehydrogenase
MQFQSGVLGSLTWSTCIYDKTYEGSITVMGEFGTIKIGGQSLNEIAYWDVRDLSVPNVDPQLDAPKTYRHYHGTRSHHDRVIREVIAKLLGEPNSAIEATDCIESIRTIERIYASARANAD